jgi:hypothetical protein
MCCVLPLGIMLSGLYWRYIESSQRMGYRDGLGAELQCSQPYEGVVRDQQ